MEIQKHRLNPSRWVANFFIPDKSDKKIIASTLIFGLLVAVLNFPVDSKAVPLPPEPQDLFISEYIEGSSYNKALEIFNGTGGPITIRSGSTHYYFLLLVSNPAGTKTWANDGSVSLFDDGAIINNEAVYVLSHSSAGPEISAESDQTSGATTFNGNDPVALVKDINNNGTYEDGIDVILDVIGDMSGTDWGGDVTLVRNYGSFGNGGVYNEIEFQVHPQDTFNLLGLHDAHGDDLICNELDETGCANNAEECSWDVDHCIELDTDEDTIPDSEDNCPDDTNTDQLDTDDDGIGDVCDTPICPNDCSGQGTCTALNTCECQQGYIGSDCSAVMSCFGTPFTDPNVCSMHGTCEEEDTCACAQDWEGAECDVSVVPDSDEDDIPDSEDNCPDIPNFDQQDMDSDGVGDVCDNCPPVPNPGQEDSNENGIGDACDVQCPPENPLACPDGTCVNDPQMCTGGGFCPPELPFKCADGACEESPGDCEGDGFECPIDLPFRCMDGECVTEPDECSDSGFGCPPELPFRCADGNCAVNPQACGAGGGEFCPPEDPIRCFDGACVPEPEMCEDLGGACGNGIIEYFNGEQCDGVNLDGQTCENFGFTGGGLTCSQFCGFDLALCTGGEPQECGNGMIEGNESCDDGNTVSGDGCSIFCQFEVGGDDACFMHMDSSSCESGFSCIWDWGQNFCVPSFNACNNYPNQEVCSGDPKCFWDAEFFDPMTRGFGICVENFSQGYPDGEPNYADLIYVFPQPFNNSSHDLSDGDPFEIGNRPDQMMDAVPRVWDLYMFPLTIGFGEDYDQIFVDTQDYTDHFGLYRYDDMSNSWTDVTSNLEWTNSNIWDPNNNDGTGWGGGDRYEIFASTVSPLDPNMVYRVVVHGMTYNEGTPMEGQINTCPDGSGDTCFTSTFMVGDDFTPGSGFQGGGDVFTGTGGCGTETQLFAQWPFEGAVDVDPNVFVDIQKCDPSLDLSDAQALFSENGSDYTIVGNIYGGEVGTPGLQIEPQMPLTIGQQWTLVLSSVSLEPDFSISFTTGNFEAPPPGSPGGTGPGFGGGMVWGSGKMIINLVDQAIEGEPFVVEEDATVVVACGELSMPDMGMGGPGTIDPGQPPEMGVAFFMDGFIAQGQSGIVINGIPTPSEGEEFENPCMVFLRPDTGGLLFGAQYTYTGGLYPPGGAWDYQVSGFDLPIPPNSKYAEVRLGDFPDNEATVYLEVTQAVSGSLEGTVCFDDDESGDENNCGLGDAKLPDLEINLFTMGPPTVGRGTWMRNETDNDGDYSFEDLPGGNYMLEMWGDPDSGQKFNYFTPITISGETTHDIVISLGLTLNLTINNDAECWNSDPIFYDFWPQTWGFDTHPVAGETESLTPSIQGFADEMYNGFIEVPGCKTVNDVQVNFERGAAELLVTLSAGISLSGKVVTDPENPDTTGVANMPFDMHTVFSPGGFGIFGDFVGGGTDGNGNFNITGLSLGDWMFESFGGGENRSFVSGEGSLDVNGIYEVTESASDLILVVRQDKRVNITVNDGIELVRNAMIDIECEGGKFVHLGHSNNVWTHLSPGETCTFRVFDWMGNYEPFEEDILVTIGQDSQDVILTLESYNRNLDVYGGFLKADKVTSFPGGTIKYMGHITSPSVTSLNGHTAQLTFPESISTENVSVRTSQASDCSVSAETVSCPISGLLSADFPADSFFDVFIEIDIPNDYQDNNLATSLNLASEALNIDNLFTEIVRIDINSPKFVGSGEEFNVYGQAYPNSTVSLSYIDSDTGAETALGSTIMEPGSSWYTFAASITDLDGGDYTLKVNVTAEGISDNASTGITVGGETARIVSVSVDGTFGSMPTNPSTGYPAGQIFEMDPYSVTLCFSHAPTPSVQGTFIGETYDFSDTGNDCWEASVTEGWTGFGNVDFTITADDGDIDYGSVAEILVLIDPSGYIYDTSDGNRIEGATATVYQLVAGTDHDTLAEGTTITSVEGADDGSNGATASNGEIEDGEEGVEEGGGGQTTEFAVGKITGCYTTSGTLDTDKCRWATWDATPSGQVNPQVTDLEGDYGWNVAQGWYRVSFQKENEYALSYSRDVYVPPAETTLNLNLGANDIGAPSVVSFNPADESTDVARNANPVIVFSEPMLSSTINTTNIQLLDNGSPISTTIVYDSESNTATITPSANLTASTTYTIRVKTAVKDDSSNALALLVESTFTTSVAADTLAPVSTASLATGTYGGTQTITLSATDNEDLCTNCTIYYTTDESEPTLSSTVYTSSLTVSNSLTLKFFAVDVANNPETPVNSRTYSIIVSVPEIPTNFSGSFLSDESVSLTWDDVDGATGYKIYRTTTSGEYSDVLTSPTNSLYTDETTTTENTYYYKVAASNLAGDSGLSAEITVSDYSSSNATYTSTTSGQADLSGGVTSLVLGNSTVMDVSGNMSTASGGNVTVGGNTIALNNFTSGDLSGVNLSVTQSVGRGSVTIAKSVKLESGVNGAPITLSNNDFSTATVSFPDGTAVLAPSGWNGQIMPPKSGSTSGIAPSGFAVGSGVVEVGSSSEVLLFDTPVSVVINGIQIYVGYKPAGSSTWTQITQTCSGTYASPGSPTFPGECFITDSGLEKTKIYTYHLTTFGGMSSTGGGSSSSRGGGGGSGYSRPGSTPFTLPTEVSNTRYHSFRPIIMKSTEGKITRPVKIEDFYGREYVEIAKGTLVTDNSGSPFLGTILPPSLLKSSQVPKITEDFELFKAVKLGTLDGTLINFSTPYTLTIPIIGASNIKAKNLKIFWYDDNNSKFVLVGDGGVISTDRSTISAKIDHMSIFAVFDAKGQRVVSIDATPKGGKPTALKKVSSVTMEKGEISIPPALIQPVPPFKDTQGHWAREYIDQLRIHGVISGKRMGEYEPNGSLTRAELTKISVNSFGIETPASVSQNPFKDVDQNLWYSPYITVARDNNIVSGYSDGTFRPNEFISRVEALKIILETSGLNLSVEFPVYFVDSVVGSWYEKYVNFAHTNGLIDGFRGAMFKPEIPITRAEIARAIVKVWEILNRVR